MPRTANDALREAVIRSVGDAGARSREELLEMTEDVLDSLTVDGILLWKGGEGDIDLTERGNDILASLRRGGRQTR